MLITTIVIMLIGSLWHSPSLFGDTWESLIGKSEKELHKIKKRLNFSYGINFIATFILSYVFAYIIRATNTFTVLGGVLIGLLCWVGFVATTSIGSVLFEGKSKELYFLHNGFQLVSFITAGIILTLYA